MIDLNNYKKIGILGGTFNPIHMGHLLMAEKAREAADLDIVILMPSGISYLKTHLGVLSGPKRLEMVDLAIQDNPHFISSDIEIMRQGNTYTYETLLYFKEQYPDSEVYFIVGADSLFSMEKWMNPDIIFNNCTILAAGRNQTTMSQMLEKKAFLEEMYHAKIQLLEFGQIEISSSMIRENIKNHKSIRYMLPEPVRKYIMEHQLYL